MNNLQKTLYLEHSLERWNKTATKKNKTTLISSLDPRQRSFPRLAQNDILPERNNISNALGLLTALRIKYMSYLLHHLINVYALHCLRLRWIALDYVGLRCIELHYVALHCNGGIA